ncbi:MAG: sulfite exporter TauE/SafE family protein [Bacteroidota bacterium]
MLDLAAVFAAGLLGSAHCIGMCGGLVAVVSRGSRSTARQGAYYLGKTLTYIALGVLAALVGAAAAEAVSGAQIVLSTAMGLVLVAIGLGLCGVLPGTREPGRGTIARWLRPVLTRVLASGSAGVPLALGAVNGLLPCGLVYGMMAKAATTGSVAMGAATMGAFGLSTLPALALAGTLGARLSPGGRVWMQRAGGLLVIALGILTLTRAAMALETGSPPHAAQDLMCNPITG